MSINLKSYAIVLSIILFSIFILVSDAEARRLGGGRSVSHTGIAAGGGFSARSDHRQGSRDSRQTDRQSTTTTSQDHRQENAGNRQDDRQENADNRQEGRSEYLDEHHDEHWDEHHDDWHDDDNGGEFIAGAIVGGVIVGAATTSSTGATTNYVTTLPCAATTVTADGITYYKCDSTWYQRAQTGDQVSYVIIGPPAGF